MGLRRKWAWDKIDWDERIYLDQVAFEEELVLEMNATELVEVLALRGVRAHRGHGLDELRELLMLSLEDRAPVLEHPLDFLRQRLLWFIRTFQDKIRDQITEDCDCRCLEKPDAEVLICYTASKKIIEREMEKNGYED